MLINAKQPIRPSNKQEPEIERERKMEGETPAGEIRETNKYTIHTYPYTNKEWATMKKKETVLRGVLQLKVVSHPLKKFFLLAMLKKLHILYFGWHIYLALRCKWQKCLYIHLLMLFEIVSFHAIYSNGRQIKFPSRRITLSFGTFSSFKYGMCAFIIVRLFLIISQTNYYAC